MTKKTLAEFGKKAPWHDPTKKPYILVDNVSKSYNGVPALNQVYLDVYKGEFFSLLGPSGCGKSTLLRILAGFESATSGRIYLDGVDMTDIPPYDRPVNMMFQNYALFPHMTVEDNIIFGLKQERLSTRTIQDRLREMLALVKLEKYRERKPHQLSGGQKQRTALARCLIKRPKLILLDEPLAALDKKLREHTQFELVNIQEKVGITFIVVTHDQQEAMTMSSRLGVMDEGRIRQVGTPTEIYEFPNSEYVADFIGRTNVVYGVVVEESSDYTTVKSDAFPIKLRITHKGNVAVGSQVTVALRPEKITLHKTKPDLKHNYAVGVVSNMAYLGDISIIHVRLPQSETTMRVMVPNTIRQEMGPVNWGDEVYLAWRPGNAVILTA